MTVTLYEPERRRYGPVRPFQEDIVRMKIIRICITLLLAGTALAVSAASSPVAGIGANVEALTAGASADGKRLLVVAGRRAPGKDFGPFSEVGLVVVPAAGGSASFTRIPELDGTRTDEVRYAFSAAGELFFTKATGSGAIRLGKVSSGRFVGVNIPLPPALIAGDFQVVSVTPLVDGRLDLAVRSMGDGVLVTLKPDLSVQAIRMIPRSSEFQGALRQLPGGEKILVVSASGSVGLSGTVRNDLAVRGPDLAATPAARQLPGLVSTLQQSSDGTRIALATRTALPGLVTAHLFDEKLEPVQQLVVVEQASYPWPVDLVLSNTHMVALHADSGKCIATVVDSRSGRQLARHELAGPGKARCSRTTGAIAGTNLLLVTTTMQAAADGVNASMATAIMPL